jgi:hypothetical protein
MSEILLVNPRRRRKHKAKHRRRSSARRSHSRTVKRYRRNPSLRGMGSSYMTILKSGLIGGAGGVGNDILYAFAARYLPLAMTTGIVRHLTKLGMAIAVGSLGGMVLKGKGAQLAAGAAACAIRDAAREQLVVAFPTLPMGDYDPELLGFEDNAQHVGEYMPQGDFAQVGLGEYMP